MSLNIRYLTNGVKKVFTVSNTGTNPPTFEIYDKREDIEKNIRHYAPKGEPTYCKPDLARLFGVRELFYPGHPNCIIEEYADRKCIAESCKHKNGCEIAVGAKWNNS